MGNPFDPLNIILIVIAVVGFIRLRMILGRRTGNEDPVGRKKTPPYTKEEKIINILKNLIIFIIILDCISFIFISNICNTWRVFCRSTVRIDI